METNWSPGFNASVRISGVSAISSIHRFMSVQYILMLCVNALNTYSSVFQHFSSRGTSQKFIINLRNLILHIVLFIAFSGNPGRNWRNPGWKTLTFRVIFYLSRVKLVIYSKLLKQIGWNFNIWCVRLDTDCIKISLKSVKNYSF